MSQGHPHRTTDTGLRSEHMAESREKDRRKTIDSMDEFVAWCARSPNGPVNREIVPSNYDYIGGNPYKAPSPPPELDTEEIVNKYALTWQESLYLVVATIIWSLFMFTAGMFTYLIK